MASKPKKTDATKADKAPEGTVANTDTASTNLPATTTADKPASSGTAVASAKASAVTMGGEFGAFDGMGTGFENVTSRDLIIPRLTILQGLSPQVTQGKPEFDETAKVGDIYDVGLQQRFPNGMLFIPCFYKKSWLEWAPRASGKGLQHIHETDLIMNETEKDDRGRDILKNGNYIAETAQLYGLNVTGDLRKSFIPMTSTQLKKVRRLMTLATSEKIKNSEGREFTPPLFFRAYMFTTVPESNNEGNWMGWKIERDKSLPELFAENNRWQDVLLDIKEFRDSLTKGDIRGDIASMENEAAGGGRQASGEDRPM